MLSYNANVTAKSKGESEKLTLADNSPAIKNIRIMLNIFMYAFKHFETFLE